MIYVPSRPCSGLLKIGLYLVNAAPTPRTCSFIVATDWSEQRHFLLTQVLLVD